MTDITHTTIRGWQILACVLWLGAGAIMTHFAGWWALLIIAIQVLGFLAYGYAVWQHGRLHEPVEMDLTTMDVRGTHSGDYNTEMGRVVCTCGWLGPVEAEEIARLSFTNHVLDVIIKQQRAER